MLFSPDSTFESAPPKSSCDFNSSQLSAQLYKTCSCSCNTGKSCILGSLGSGCGIKHWRTSTDLWWSGRLERFKPSSTPAPWGKTKALGLLPGAENAQECLITVLQCLRGSCKENGGSLFTVGNGYKLSVSATDFLAYSVLCSKNGNTFNMSEHKNKRQNPTSKTARLLIPCNAPS